MPSAPRPKEFVAAGGFVYAGRTYRKGDPITDRGVLAALVKYGTRFAAPVRSAPAEPTAEPAAPHQSTKED